MRHGRSITGFAVSDILQMPEIFRRGSITNVSHWIRHARLLLSAVYAGCAGETSNHLQAPRGDLLR